MILLRRSGLKAEDIVTVYSTTVRPILEYAAPVWHSSLTREQCKLIENIQKRALKIAHPQLSYEEALHATKLPFLEQRREQLSKHFFKEMCDPSHKLFHILPETKSTKYNFRKEKTFDLPKCKTNRYKKSFIPYCLFNYQ